jgi:hypothetical protein
VLGWFAGLGPLLVLCCIRLIFLKDFQTNNSAASDKDKGHAGALYSNNSYLAALGLYGGVLWCGELQGFIIHEMMPNPMFSYILQLTAWPVASNGHKVKH